MGNKIDPKCKEIYAEYKKCFEDWRNETDMRQWYHEGDSEECQKILDDFHFCCKEQMSRVTNAKLPDKIAEARESVLNEKKQNDSDSNANVSNIAGTNAQNITQNEAN